MSNITGSKAHKSGLDGTLIKLFLREGHVARGGAPLSVQSNPLPRIPHKPRRNLSVQPPHNTHRLAPFMTHITRGP